MRAKPDGRRWLLILSMLLLPLSLLAGCGTKKTDVITSVEQLNEPGRKIGVYSDTAEDQLVARELPQAQIEYMKDHISAFIAVSQGKLDAFVYDRRQMELAIKSGQKGVRLLDATLGEGNRVAVGISPVTKFPDLEAKLNEFIAEIKADGTLDDMQLRWIVQNNETMPDIPVPESAPLHLVVGTTGSLVPYSYYAGTELAGQEIELARRFAAWVGAELEFKVYDFEGIVAAAQGGDIDCIMSNLFVTPEREEAIPFSDPYSLVEIGVLVRDAEQSGSASFWTDIRENFQKTFLRENRWQLFLSGIGTTLLITVLSILFGTLLGFFTFMLCRNGHPAANAIARFCVWLVQGLPVVVLLMVLYYIVFGNVVISGKSVSVIGFTLVFGASVFSMMKTGVGAIDRGQLEAAYALGYSNLRAFFRVILPQALPHFMPAYKAEITAIIKATAVVGYIAVQDLTKTGDIVRSRTYEAFFPLIAVAVIYFVLAALLTFLVNRVELKIDLRKRTPEKIRKEVEGK